MTSVLVIGDYRQSLMIARSLAARGNRVVVTLTDERESYLRHCRAVDQVWRPDVEFGSPRFADVVRAAVTAFDIDVVFPVGDREIRWFVANDDLLDVAIAGVDATTAALCQDKPALLEIATELGVEHAASSVVHDRASLVAAARKAGYPCIVKSNDPLRRLLGTKGIICESPADLEVMLGAWPDGHESLIVQRFVSGPRHNLYFAAERGEVRCLSQVEILRTDSVDGTGYAVDGATVEPMPALEDATRRLVRELKYHGVGCTQFLVSADGQTSFLELNPRLGANFAVVDGAGIHLARDAVDIALGRRITPRRGRVGVRYAWTTGDLDGLLHAVARGELTFAAAVRWLWSAIATGVAADVHVTWSWRDPLPTLVTLWRDIVGSLGRRLLPRSGR